MRRTLKSFSGLILGIAFLAAVVSLLVIIVSLLHSLHIDDVPESAALILAFSVGVILVAGILLTLIEIAEELTAANERKRDNELNRTLSGR
jgi:hypothetical protein